MTARILSFDNETSHLKADFGTLLCWGYKWLDEKKVHVPSLLTHPGKHMIDDRPLVKHVHEIMGSADMWVTYFGKGFDVPFLNSKFLEYGLSILPNIPHVDLYFTVKSNMSLSRKSLQNVAYHLDLEAKKTPVEGRIWKKAMIGDQKSLLYIIKHCRSDVLLLEEAYLRLRPLVRTHPRVSGFGPCRYCGSTRLQRRGIAITKLKNEQQRIQCQACGGWDQRAATA